MKLNFIFIIHDIRQIDEIMSKLLFQEKRNKSDIVILTKNNIKEKLAGIKLPLNKFYFASGYSCLEEIEKMFNESIKIDTFLKWNIFRPESIKKKEKLIII